MPGQAPGSFLASVFAIPCLTCEYSFQSAFQWCLIWTYRRHCCTFWRQSALWKIGRYSRMHQYSRDFFESTLCCLGCIQKFLTTLIVEDSSILWYSVSVLVTSPQALFIVNIPVTPYSICRLHVNRFFYDGSSWGRRWWLMQPADLTKLLAR